MPKNIKELFPILSSVVVDGETYNDLDLRSRFLWVLERFGDHYLPYEITLASMPTIERDFIMNKLLNYVRRDKILGWHQFYDVLIEVEAYQYLSDCGAKDITFVKDAGCPDLEANFGEKQVFLEAKNIHNSLQESKYLQRSAVKPEARTVGVDIPNGLKSKVESDIVKAKDQLSKYKPTNAAQREIFMVIHPDIGVKLNNDLWKEMDIWLEEKKDGLLRAGYSFRATLRW